LFTFEVDIYGLCCALQEIGPVRGRSGGQAVSDTPHQGVKMRWVHVQKFKQASGTFIDLFSPTE